MKRKVYIKFHIDSWLICYASRRKHQRYLAGQFYGDYSRQQVEEWVEKQPKLELVDAPV